MFLLRSCFFYRDAIKFTIVHKPMLDLLTFAEGPMRAVIIGISFAPFLFQMQTNYKAIVAILLVMF